MRITGYESNEVLLKELGQRIKDARIAANYSQSEMAERSGVALSTLARIERGESVTTENVLNVLRALGVLSNLEVVLPEQTVKPTDIADGKAKRRRVSRERNRSVSPEWVWEEDKK